MKTIRLNVSGMTCSACSTRIEKSILRMEGVSQASVNLALAQASIILDPRRLPVKEVIDKIEQLGYKATDEATTPHANFQDEARTYRNRFLLALFLSIPLLWAMLYHMTNGRIGAPTLFHEPLFQWGIATVLQFYVGFPFYYGAFQAIKQRSANMDVLVALSTSVAYFYSHYSIMNPEHAEMHGHLYFDTIAMIMTAVLLGKWLESVAKGRALQDVIALHDLQVRLIRVIRRQEEEWIKADELRKGDRVIVRSGEWISADGIVLSGQAEVDEAMLTGEISTVLKKNGDRVYSGTRSVNGSLSIEAETQTAGTRLSRMIALVEEAQNEKPLLARKVDRIAAYFVPVMILCAVFTFIFWFSAAQSGFEPAMLHAMSVLLVACPCALGLATPVSILIATGLSARQGILFKGGRALETLHRVDHVLLDKTGTLTEGRPQLKTIDSIKYPNSYILRLAAALEQHSAHPLALAVVEAARKLKLLLPEAQQMQEVPGGGVTGLVEGQTVRVGHWSWLQQHGLIIGDWKEPATSQVSRDMGATVLHVALDQEVIGQLSFADQLRKDATDVVSKLQRYSEVWMVTGDQQEAARLTAEEAGITQVRFGMAPEQKLEFVQSLQKQGRRVAILGDGINDAAALAAADIGIAMGGGTNAAIQAGDVVLVHDHLSGVTDAIEISKATMRNIRQNLFLAVIYNFCTIPLAAFGYLDPRAACMGMAVSSFAVVFNALRLQRYKIGGEQRS